MHYKGSCHCGRVAFEVGGKITGALSCNCSICQRKGSLLWFVPSAASTYTFNKHTVRHRFCAACGIHPYGEGTDPTGNAIATINLRCIEGLDLATIPVQHFDGRAL